MSGGLGQEKGLRRQEWRGKRYLSRENKAGDVTQGETEGKQEENRLSRREEAGEPGRIETLSCEPALPTGCLSPIKFYWHTALFVQACVACD